MHIIDAYRMCLNAAAHVDRAAAAQFHNCEADVELQTANFRLEISDTRNPTGAPV